MMEPSLRAQGCTGALRALCGQAHEMCRAIGMRKWLDKLENKVG
jgi:hypothetical protein